MTLEQKSGTVLDASEPIVVFFAVQVLDSSGPIVNKVGSSSATIVPLNKVSVGDFVWVDSNRDGRQSTGEPGIPGVVLRITGPDGLPVTDVYGNPVGPVTTDKNGKYTFENLPTLTGDQTYTVRIDKDASATALAPYVPTKPGVGDRAGDSSSWVATTVPGQLHGDGDRDPTLDFGFVQKTYAIGDVVWIDANGNGKQDTGEKPLEGVKVELFKDGKSIATTATDSKGRYVFDNLPAGTYRVKFTLTDEQKKKYEFTTRNAGTDTAIDSDANPTTGWTRTIVLDDSNTALTGDYEYRQIGATQGIDPTWDAGVVLKDTDSEPTTDDDDDTGSLPVTGLTIGLGTVATGFVLVLLGMAVMRISRRRVT
ncbi:MAG: SdrD B-like domain-containing protein [Nocardioides sp.]